MSARGAIRGVNLSGWLILEQWVSPDVFAGTGAIDQPSLLERLGRTRYVETVLQHWDSFITREDFQHMAQRGFEAVRLPVPWHVFGPQGPLPGIHPGCLSHVDDAFDWAEEAGLCVLLDIGSAPESTLSSNGVKLELDFTISCREALLDVVAGLARRYAGRDAFLGIEPIDEVRAQQRHGFTVSEGVPMSSLRMFYREAYDAVRDVAGDDPIVVLSDAGRPDAWRRFMAQGRFSRVWLDTHLYRFSDRVDASGPAGVRSLVGKCSTALNQARESGLPVMVGEWSGALPYADAATTPEGRIAAQRIFISAQLAAYESCPAWFFQTWKTGTRLRGWDARISLSSFEKDML